MTDTAVPVRKTPASIADGAKRPERIAVSKIIWKKPKEVPGRQGESSLTCLPDDGRPMKRWSCDLIPSMRHFEITYFPANQLESVSRFYIHESDADGWWPLAV